VKVKKEELQKILENLRPGLTKRDIVNKLSEFTFSGERICTFNDQISISHPFKSDFECSIDGQSFYQVVINSPGEMINLEVTEKSLVIKGEKSKAILAISENSVVLDKIKMPDISSKKWKQLPELFIEGIKLCSFSVSKDLTRPYLTCVAVKDNKVFSCDNLRMSKFLLDKSVGDKFLILGESATILTKYPVKKFLKDESWVHFKTESDTIFSCKVIVDIYPDLDQYFNVEGLSFALPDELKSVVDSVAVVTDEEFSIDNIISVSIEKKEKIITCCGIGTKGSFERICQLEGRIQRDVTFAINPAFFSEILNYKSEMVLGENHALFTGKSFEHVMCLPRK